MDALFPSGWLEQGSPYWLVGRQGCIRSNIFQLIGFLERHLLSDVGSRGKSGVGFAEERTAFVPRGSDD